MIFKPGQIVTAILEFPPRIVAGRQYSVTESDGVWTTVIDNLGGHFCLETKGLASVPTAAKSTTLPTDSNERKNYPLFRGLLRYFPAALAGVAKISKLGNDKHNPGEEMHHARMKSMDHGDCILRHLTDVEDLLAAKERGDSSVTSEAILLEVSQMAWRALALSQELHEKFGAPLAPGAKK